MRALDLSKTLFRWSAGVIRQLAVFWAVTLAFGIGAISAAQTTPAVMEDDVFIFEIRLAQFILSRSTIGYLTDDDVCLRLDDLVDALDFAINVTEDGANGWFINLRQTFVFDYPNRTLKIRDKNVELGPKDLYDDMGSACVTTKAIERWFPLSLSVDQQNSTIKITSNTPLPVEERAARKRRQASVNKTPEATELKDAKIAPYAVLSTPQLEVSIAADRTPDDISSEMDIVSAGDVLGMSSQLVASVDDERGLIGVRGTLSRFDEAGLLPDGPHLTQFRLGDVATPITPLSTTSKPGRGIQLSSARVDQADVFDRTTIRGDLPNGWEAELYRNGTLLGLVSSRQDRRYEFVDVQLLYGRNHFVVKLYGPQGQRREEVQEFFVGNDFLKPGHTNFTLTAIQQDIPTFYSERIADNPETGTIRAAAGLEMGITKKLTGALGASSYKIGDERVTYLDGGVRTTAAGVGIDLNISHQVNEGSGISASVQKQFGTAALSTLYERFYDYESDQASTKGENGIMQRGLARADLVLNVGDSFAIPVSLYGKVSEYQSGVIEPVVSARTSFRVGDISVTNETRHRSLHRPNGESTERNDGNILMSRITKFGSIRVSADYEISPDPQISRYGVSSDFRLSERVGAKFEVTQATATGATSASFGVNTHFSNMAVGGYARFTDDGDVAAGFSITTSLLRAPGQSGTMRTKKSIVGGGTLLVRGFVDDNADGLWSENEKLLEEFSTKVNGRSSTDYSETLKGIVTTSAPTHEPLLVELDMQSINDPYLLAGNKGEVHALRPGRTVVVDLPLVRTGEVLGDILLHRENDTIAIGDVDIELINAKNIVVAETRSEYDGFFVFERVPYGTYRVRLNEEQADRLGLRLDNEPHLTVSATADVVDGVGLMVSLAPEEPEDPPTPEDGEENLPPDDKEIHGE